jgi:hypothetical protein
MARCIGLPKLSGSCGTWNKGGGRVQPWLLGGEGWCASLLVRRFLALR